MRFRLRAPLLEIQLATSAGISDETKALLTKKIASYKEKSAKYDAEKEEIKVTRIAAFTIGLVAILLAIPAQNLNIAFLVALAFAVAASANLPAIVMIRPSLPYKTLGEFIAAAKQQPGKFNYASAGPGNWTHLFMAYLNSQAGIDQVNVIYRSGAEMLTSLLKDEADTAIITVSTALGQIREGKVRALAGVSMQPMKQLPDVPPVGRTIPGFDVKVWHGIVGPAGMDPALTARINGIFNQVLQVPAVRQQITESQAADIVGGSPADFAAYIKSEIEKWAKIVRMAKVKIE